MKVIFLKKTYVLTIICMIISVCMLPITSCNQSNSVIDQCMDIDYSYTHTMVKKTLGKESGQYNDRIDESNLEYVTICLKKFDGKEGMVDVPVGSMSIEQAYILKGELERIWKTNLSVNEKTKNSILLFDGLEDFQVPLNNLANIISYENEEKCSNNDYMVTSNGDSIVFNFLSLWGAFCIGQPNVYVIGGDLVSEKIWSRESDDSSIWNMSFFFEFGIGALVLPFLGWGFFGTYGLFGDNTLQNPVFTSPKTFFGFIVGALFIGLSFKIGNPYLSLFELYLGVAGFPFAFPL